MDQLDKIIDEATRESIHNGVRRVKYMPYQMDIALSVIERIAKRFVPGFELTPRVKEVYVKLVQYFHGDPDFPGNLEKGLMLIGPTGTGKTLAMKIMEVYRKIDDIVFIMNGRTYRMNFEIIHINDIADGFMDAAFDGIDPYCKRYVLCLDDLGTEIERVKHYGNDLDVISFVLSERYQRQLLTFATSNFAESALEEKYGDRVFSRMRAMFNFIILKERDFRI